MLHQPLLIFSHCRSSARPVESHSPTCRSQVGLPTHASRRLNAWWKCTLRLAFLRPCGWLNSLNPSVRTVRCKWGCVEPIRRKCWWWESILMFREHQQCRPCRLKRGQLQKRAFLRCQMHRLHQLKLPWLYSLLPNPSNHPVRWPKLSRKTGATSRRLPCMRRRRTSGRLLFMHLS